MFNFRILQCCNLFFCVLKRQTDDMDYDSKPPTKYYIHKTFLHVHRNYSSAYTSIMKFRKYIIRYPFRLPCLSVDDRNYIGWWLCVEGVSVRVCARAWLGR